MVIKTSGLPESASPWRRSVINPLNDSTIYANLFDCGIYRSVDGAESWKFSSEGITITYINDLAVDSTMSEKAYAVAAGYGKSLAKTIDGGASWEYLHSPRNLGVVGVDPQIP
jgi:photosystem II stability/assembly factor-like uncharacterized protein